MSEFSQLLISDPMMEWYSPTDMIFFRRLNKQSKQHFTDHMKAYKTFNTRSIPHVKRQYHRRLFNFYPNVRHLSIQPRYNVIDYNVCSLGDFTINRSNLTSLEIEVSLQLSYTENTRKLYWTNWRDIEGLVDDLQYIPKFDNIHITFRFNPSVSIHLSLKNHIFIGHTKHGAEYEDYDVYESTSQVNPAHYSQILRRISRNTYDDVGYQLAHVLNERNIKVTAPYHFPGAQYMKNVTYTDEFELDGTLARNHIWDLYKKHSKQEAW